MIAGWLLRIVIVLGLVGFLVVEAGSPLIVRAQVDDAAHDAADNAAAEYRTSANVDAARAVAEREAGDEGATLEHFSVDTQGVVQVTLVKEARSALLKKVSALASWYDVRVSASGAGPTNN